MQSEVYKPTRRTQLAQERRTPLGPPSGAEKALSLATTEPETIPSPPPSKPGKRKYKPLSPERLEQVKAIGRASGHLGGRPKNPDPISEDKLADLKALPAHKRKKESEEGWSELEYLYRTHLRRHLVTGGKKDLNFVRSMTISGGIAKDKAYPPELKEQLPVNVPAKLLTQINVKIGIVNTVDSRKTIVLPDIHSQDAQNITVSLENTNSESVQE